MPVEIDDLDEFIKNATGIDINEIRENARLARNERNKKSYHRRKDANKDKLKYWWKKNTIKYKYGLTLEQVDAIRKHQHNRCAICGLEDVPLVIDHCKYTLAVRGLLCNECNLGLGWFSHMPYRLEKASYYLSQWPAYKAIGYHKVPKDIPNPKRKKKNAQFHILQRERRISTKR